MRNKRKQLLDSSKQFISGPSSRGRELKQLVQVGLQMFKSFRKLHFVGPCVTVFGSARFTEDHDDYKIARTVGNRIAQMGFTTMTGGGPGIMEAANRGAKEAGGRSIGCTINLPMEQKENPYLDTSINFDYFFLRKFILLKYSYAFIVLPGGFGTLDELFETVTLIQTKMIENFPIVVIGKSYYQTMEAMITKMWEEETISKKDMDLILFTDSVDEAMSHIERFVKENYTVESKSQRPFKWLGEADNFFDQRTHIQ